MSHSIRSAVLVLGLALGSIPCHAAMVEVVNCGPVTIAGHVYTRMNLRIAPPPGGGVDLIQVAAGGLPGVTDTCHVVEALPPQDWFSEVTGNGGANFYTISELAILHPASQAGFFLTLSQPRSCVRFELSGTGGVVASAIVCFEACGATPTRPSSWGGVKAAYR